MDCVAIDKKPSKIEVVTLISNVELEMSLINLFRGDEFEVEEEEVYCEEFFTDNCQQTESGQFIVKMPFKDGLTKTYLGDSRRCAIAQQFQLEQKFKKNPVLKEEYSKRSILVTLRRSHTIQNNFTTICRIIVLKKIAQQQPCE